MNSDNTPHPQVDVGRFFDQLSDDYTEVVERCFHWLILHGRYVCTARKPHCRQCIIADLCKYDAKTASTAAPITNLQA